MKIPGLSFSLKRAVGVSAVKQKIAKKTGIMKEETTKKKRRRPAKKKRVKKRKNKPAKEQDDYWLDE